MSNPNFFKQFGDPSRSQYVASSSDDSDSPSMATRKRSRDANDIDGEVEVETASSALRHTNSLKRSRVALAAERGGSVVSDDDEDEDDVPQPPANDDPSDREDGEDGDDSEVDEITATQIVEKQIREHRDNLASEQGVIEEVFCRNFMCHSKLRIKLGPLINFIIGHNGSGKSAVLTALTMCLGGKATATNRGASLKALIKEGEESATLSVKIKNQGDAAYKSDLYGPSIIVERNFTRSGTSGFKLKNAQEKTVSTKKSDLDDILDFYAFQLDNPINVLTQDMARQFLSNSTPSDKYKFFIRGTQLETLDNDYKIMEEHLDNMEDKLRTRDGDVQKLMSDMEEAARKKKRADRTLKLHDDVRKIQYQHAWAQVEEQEDILRTCETQIEHYQSIVQDKETRFEAISGTYNGHDQAFEAAERHLTQIKEQQEPLQQTFDEAKEAFDANKNNLTDLAGEERLIKSHWDRAKKDVKRLETEVAQESERLAGAAGEAHQARVAKLDELTAAAQEAEKTQMQHGTGFAALERQRTDAFEAHEEGKKILDEQRNRLGTAEAQLARLQRAQPRPFDGFANNMEQLVRAVDRETRWRTKPVGPMGRHIRLLKPEWSSPLEKMFGANLDAFIVTNYEDQRMLSQLMKKVGCHVNTLKGDASLKINTDGKEPDEGIDTILRVLEIDNELVRNQCIINQAIEQVALMPNREDAMKLMFEGGTKPHNVRVAMCLVADPGKSLRLEFTRTGQQKTSPVAAWHGPVRMKTDHERQVRAHREAVDHVKRDVNAADQNVKNLKRTLDQAGQAVKRFEGEQKKLKLDGQRAEDAVEAQRNEIENNRPQDGKLQELERQLAEAKEEYEVQTASIKDMINAKDRSGETGRELKGKLDVAYAALEKSKQQVIRADERVNQLRGERQHAMREKNAAAKAVEDAQSDVTGMRAKRDRQRQRIDDDFIPMANQICSRVNVEAGMTPAKLDKRLESLAKEVRLAEQHAGGSSNELTIAYRHAEEAYKEAVAQMAEMKKCANTIRHSLDYRHKRWELFRKYIAMRLRMTFAYLLSERQFRGRALLDHDAKLLEIRVEPNLALTSDAGREARTLSGGEKSFSTICLLLSIWEAMGSPIRCLDEFDVFMDSVNRATSMTMMIQAARRSVGRQFILITPQAMGGVEQGDDVKIHRMSDPERGQTTLPF